MVKLKPEFVGRNFNNLKHANDTVLMADNKKKTTGPPGKGVKGKREERTNHHLQEYRTNVYQ